MPPTPNTTGDASMFASAPRPIDPTPGPTTPTGGGIDLSAEPEGGSATRPITKPEEPASNLASPLHKAGGTGESESAPVPAPLPTTTDDRGPDPGVRSSCGTERDHANRSHRCPDPSWPNHIHCRGLDISF